MQSIHLLGDYYVKIPLMLTDNIEKYHYIELRNEIPVVNYNNISMSATGVHYNPAAIAIYSIGIFEKYRKQNLTEHKFIFFKQIDWLKNNLVIKQLDRFFGVWEYNFDLPYWNQKAPWISALAQGFGLSALSRAYLITSETTYLELCELVMNSYKYQIQDGGTCYIDDIGNKWFEEYPSYPPSNVLNGFIYALFGLLDFHKVSGNLEAFQLFNDGISTLKKNIKRYDTGFWSLYSLHSPDNGGISDLHYHRDIHVPQVKALHKITHEEIFDEIYVKWQSYVHSPYSYLRRRSFHLPQRIVRKILRHACLKPN